MINLSRPRDYRLLWVAAILLITANVIIWRHLIDPAQ